MLLKPYSRLLTSGCLSGSSLFLPIYNSKNKKIKLFLFNSHNIEAHIFLHSFYNNHESNPLKSWNQCLLNCKNDTKCWGWMGMGVSRGVQLQVYRCYGATVECFYYEKQNRTLMQHTHHDPRELKQTENSSNIFLYSGEYLFHMCRASTCLAIILLCNDFQMSCVLCCTLCLWEYISNRNLPISLGNDYPYYAGNGQVWKLQRNCVEAENL